MNIVEALEQLKLEGMEGAHDHVIETVLSKLFIRGDEVHKAYKHRTADFADLTLRDVRRQYIAEDFFWNNAMAPEIYLELRHVKHDEGRLVHAEQSEGEDWYIVMQKIDTSKDLMRAIVNNALKKEELEAYVKTLTERLKVLTKARRGELEEFFTKDAAHIRAEVLGACDWAASDGTPHITLGEVTHARSLMQEAFEQESYFQQPNKNISVVIDTNAENIIFLDGGVSFIDVMPPKDAWRVHDRYFLICRTSADIKALLGGDYAAVLHDEYQKDAGELPPDVVTIVYEIAAALIQVPYRKMVGQPELAQKYADFVRLRCNELEVVLRGEEIDQ